MIEFFKKVLMIKILIKIIKVNIFLILSIIILIKKNRLIMKNYKQILIDDLEVRNKNNVVLYKCIYF